MSCFLCGKHRLRAELKSRNHTKTTLQSRSIFRQNDEVAGFRTNLTDGPQENNGSRKLSFDVYIMI